MWWISVKGLPSIPVYTRTATLVPSPHVIPVPGLSHKYQPLKTLVATETSATDSRSVGMVFAREGRRLAATTGTFAPLIRVIQAQGVSIHLEMPELSVVRRRGTVIRPRPARDRAPHVPRTVLNRQQLFVVHRQVFVIPRNFAPVPAPPVLRTNSNHRPLSVVPRQGSVISRNPAQVPVLAAPLMSKRQMGPPAVMATPAPSPIPVRGESVREERQLVVTMGSVVPLTRVIPR